MDVHKNARLTVFCRELLIHRVLKGQAQAQVAAQFGVSVQTVSSKRPESTVLTPLGIYHPSGRSWK
jgi:hypothetical protein